MKGDRSATTSFLPVFKSWNFVPEVTRQVCSKAALVTAFSLVAVLGSSCDFFRPSVTNPSPSPLPFSEAPGGLSSPAPAPSALSCQDPITLRLGDRSIRVTDIQQQLLKRGHLRADYPVGQSDRYDEETAAAVAAFQKREVGLLPTGEANEATQVMLDLISVPLSSDGLPSGPVSPGDTSKTVGTLQARLTRLSYFKEPIDWTYGTKTEAAVRDFQLGCHCGLEPDGIANQITRSMILVRLKQQEDALRSFQPRLSTNFQYEF